MSAGRTVSDLPAMDPVLYTLIRKENAMNVTRLITGLILFLGVALAGNAANAAEITISVFNTTHGAYFTPLLVTAHSDAEQLFQLGQSASTEIQAMAEGGDVSGLAAQIGGADSDTVVNPAAGLLGPGESTTTTLNTDSTGNTRLSIAAMILPTNDGFVGLQSLLIPETPGTYVYPLIAYDAGTEANDELVIGAAGGAPGVAGIPAAPGGDSGSNGTGVTASETNSTVHVHRGVLGDADPNGGASDLDNTIHRWLNPVAKLVVEVP